ncbi:sugar phosphate isomerase/epimerase family protein [Neolewinella sp.]|uniref:sugar phosphate isomerase/epimerase family protein n=1 Tax=Neolewinella sp. TaxID=2993543 RepID=UPI003B5272E9
MVRNEMDMDRSRRNIIRSLALAPIGWRAYSSVLSSSSKPPTTSRVQYSVNAYSFNDALRSGELTFGSMMEFAADLGLNAVDLTAYYFGNYPEVPDDKVLFDLKKKALALGLNIPWTGVRNNFVTPDSKVRASDRELITNWLRVSATLGASLMRVFPGFGEHEGFSRAQVKEWMVADFKQCAKKAEEHGVILAMQHHNDFLYRAAEVIYILERVDSEWFGLVLDIGSLRQGDPYTEIEELAPYADYWFIKEFVYINGVATPVDMQRLAAIIKAVGYRGYLSFESLSAGDPQQIVTSMFKDFRAAYERL